MQVVLEAFKKPNTTGGETASAGEKKILLALYSCEMRKSLNTLWYQLFMKSRTKSKLDLSKLPSTQDFVH